RPHVFVPRPRASDLHPSAADDQVDDGSGDADGAPVGAGQNADASETAMAVAPETRNAVPDAGTTAADVPTVAAEARAASNVDARIAPRAVVAATSDRAAAIPMPAGPSEPTHPSEPVGPGPRESAPIAPAATVPVPMDRPADDGPRLSMESGDRSQGASRGFEQPSADAGSMPPTSERDTAAVSPNVRPDIRRRSSWLRAGGSGRAGRFGGRPISKFPSSRSEDESSAAPENVTAPDTSSPVAQGFGSTSATGARAASEG